MADFQSQIKNQQDTHDRCGPSRQNLGRVDFWQVYNMGQIYDMGQVVMCQDFALQVISSCLPCAISHY